MDVKRYILRRAAPPPAVDFGDALDPEQRQVVEAPAGPILAVAGAGSGKTRALTYRVAQLIHLGVPPERILLCTFTNRAAREMLRRVERLASVEIGRMWSGTFHHVGNLVLRRYADQLGLSPEYSILDRSDAIDLLARVIAERSQDARAQRFPQAGVLAGMISLAVNTLRPLADLLSHEYARFLHHADEIEAVAAAYLERKRRLGLMDFDDLLTGWLVALTEHPAVAAELQDRFLHVLVDEYQDVNRLQAEITDRMASGHESLTVVGDDDQSIYAFRGADVDAMLGFVDRHPRATLFRIQSNYRSTPEILRLANASIAKNRRRHKKTLRPVRAGGALPVLATVDDVYQQAAFVAERILDLHEESAIPLRQMAVLFRAHAHSLELQVELTRRQIPFSVRAGLRFFEQAHIKDALAHLRWLVNPRDELAALRVLRLQPDIGPAIAARVVEHLATRDTATDAAPLHEGLTSALSASGVTGRGRQGIKQLAPLFSALEDDRGPGPALRRVAAGPYKELAISRWPNAEARLEDLVQLADYAERYEDIPSFLNDVTLMAGMAAESFKPGDLPDDQLTLSTVHQAKGLEWQAVFVLWLCDGHFPSAMALRDADGEEEERRLFHVALTRARDHLTLVHPLLAEQSGQPRIVTRPSRFITELDDPDLLERWRVELGPQSA